MGFVAGALKTRRFNHSLHTHTHTHPLVIVVIIISTVIETPVPLTLLRIVNDSAVYILRPFQKRWFSYNFIVSCLRTVRYYCIYRHFTLLKYTDTNRTDFARFRCFSALLILHKISLEKPPVPLPVGPKHFSFALRNTLLTVCHGIPLHRTHKYVYMWSEVSSGTTFRAIVSISFLSPISVDT